MKGEKKKGKRTMGNRRGKRIDGRAEEGQKLQTFCLVGDTISNVSLIN